MIDMKSIEETLKFQENLLVDLRKTFAALPADRIWVRNQNKKPRYSLARRNDEGLLKENQPARPGESDFEQICKAMYLQKLIPALEKENRAIARFLESYNPRAKEVAYDAVPKGFEKFVINLFESDEDYCRRWAEADYERSTYPIESNRYISGREIVVRSRIELITANIIEKLGLFYRYECRLDLPKGTVYPDFAIIHPRSREIYYVEMFGMMDNVEYAEDAYKKIDKYASAGLYPRLIAFFDHKNCPISNSLIEKTLKSIFIE